MLGMRFTSNGAHVKCNSLPKTENHTKDWFIYKKLYNLAGQKMLGPQLLQYTKATL